MISTKGLIWHTNACLQWWFILYNGAEDGSERIFVDNERWLDFAPVPDSHFRELLGLGYEDEGQYACLGGLGRSS